MNYQTLIIIFSILFFITIKSQDPPSFLFILVDDIGWTDFQYWKGNTSTPNIDSLATSEHSIKFLDFHSGGTVCSPTRATTLTGRNHVRDCVYYVYDCTDPTICSANMPFGGPDPQVFTVAHAVKKANMDYESAIYGKWHLGDFYESAKFPSSPKVHGFDHFNMTLEVAPTATTNCKCEPEWIDSCMDGHYGKNSTEPRLVHCCNYWTEDTKEKEGVVNSTIPVGKVDAEWMVDSFEDFLHSRKGKPFLALLWFHNNHIPYIATDEIRQACESGEICPKNHSYSSAQLDYYGSLNELDTQIGRVRQLLKDTNYYDKTMTWFTSDNGPEGTCKDGWCNEGFYKGYPGTAMGLRGRKRDTWEGGHRVAGIVEYPPLVKSNKVDTNTPVSTIDFLPTIMELLNVTRPPEQQDWALDGSSILPLLKGESLKERGMGWWWHSNPVGLGWRWKNWKLVINSNTCREEVCDAKLYDLDKDLNETVDLSKQQPEIFDQLSKDLKAWVASLNHSVVVESKCPSSPPQFLDLLEKDE